MSNNIDDGFFKPESSNKIDYLTVKDRSQISKKEATITNDSVLNQLQNLDISLESKKFLLSSKLGGGEDINVE